MHISRVSCQKGPTRHAYAWPIGPFWQDTLDLYDFIVQQIYGIQNNLVSNSAFYYEAWGNNVDSSWPSMDEYI